MVNLMVHIVGAGPGDPRLITLKGVECIQTCDVLIYDHLVSKDLLKYVKPEAVIIYAGKLPDHHTLTQDEINALMVEMAKQGKIVTRLKGGDPFIFGRGAEEAEALVKENILFEIVPGVSSATAVPAYAGIPLTHRDYTSSFVVITGHEDPTKENTSINWNSLATMDSTLVFLMGIKNLRNIVENLVNNNKDATTPVAIITWGCSPSQQVVVGTLENIAEKAEKEQLKPPGIIVVGNVVNLRETIKWFEKKPLLNKKIIVTRARGQISDFARILTNQYAEVLEFPTIKIVPPDDFTDFDQAIDVLSSYDWVIFTSANGVDIFMNRLYHLHKDVRNLGRSKIGAIGQVTADKLKQYGILVDLVPPQFVAESLFDELIKKGEVKGKKFLLPRADLARSFLPEKLREFGGTVHQIDAYKTVPDLENKEELWNRFVGEEIDLSTFTSSSTVKNFVEAMKDYPLQELCSRVLIASIGPITSATIYECFGKKPEIEAKEYTIKGLVDGIISFYTERALACTVQSGS